jgi:hypothetical protein
MQSAGQVCCGSSPWVKYTAWAKSTSRYEECSLLVLAVTPSLHGLDRLAVSIVGYKQPPTLSALPSLSPPSTSPLPYCPSPRLFYCPFDRSPGHVFKGTGLLTLYCYRHSVMQSRQSCCHTRKHAPGRRNFFSVGTTLLSCNHYRRKSPRWGESGLNGTQVRPRAPVIAGHKVGKS